MAFSPPMYLGRIRHDIFRRAIVACALVCLLALQFAPLSGLVKWADALGVSPTAEAAGALCSPDGGHQPAPGHQHDQTKCCAYCLAGGRVASLLAFAVIYDAISYLPAKTHGVSRDQLADDPRPAAGWLISWSSRAPPVS